jgi:hypothetical protein
MKFYYVLFLKESQINKFPKIGCNNFKENKAFLRLNAAHWGEKTTQLSLELLEQWGSYLFKIPTFPQN